VMGWFWARVARWLEDKPYTGVDGVLVPCGCGCGDTP
jgi:hypothetical protein